LKQSYHVEVKTIYLYVAPLKDSGIAEGKTAWFQFH